MIAHTSAVCSVASIALSFHADVGLRQVVTGALALAFFLLGLAIAVIAFQGYRRNRSRPMLFIAIGFGLIVGSQVFAALLFFVLGVDVERFTLQTTIQVVQLAGLVSILYALRMDV